MPYINLSCGGIFFNQLLSGKWNLPIFMHFYFDRLNLDILKLIQNLLFTLTISFTILFMCFYYPIVAQSFVISFCIGGLFLLPAIFVCLFIRQANPLISILGKWISLFCWAPNKRCSGLGWSARYHSPITLAAELGVRSLRGMSVTKVNWRNNRIKWNL